MAIPVFDRIGSFRTAGKETSGAATAMVGRLAPSPTGAQHLGNARTYLLAWLAVRMQGGRLLLRIEDLDSPRVKAWAFQQAQDDLRWLGLDWDLGPGSEPLGFPRLVQTERLARYAEVLESLKEGEWVYPCTCSRKDIEQAQSAPHEDPLKTSLRTPFSREPSSNSEDTIIYPGTCAARGAGDAMRFDRLGVPFAWRFRMDRFCRSQLGSSAPLTQAESTSLASESMHWIDAFAGDQSIDPIRELGDFVVARSNGLPAYQLAVVVDDHDMEITQVVRGDDLIPSTFRQIAIYRTLNWEVPAMCHLPLVVGPDGRRLAKRHGDTRLSMLREAGIAPEIIVGYLAHASGILEELQAITPQQLLGIANLQNLVREQLVFQSSDAVRFFEGIMGGNPKRWF